MALSSLTSREAVLEAMKEYDSLGREAFLSRYGFRPAQSFFVEYGGQVYDSKAIAGVAVGKQHPEQGPLRPSEFSGGEATVRAKLEQLGFQVSDGRDDYEAPISSEDIDLLRASRTHAKYKDLSPDQLSAYQRVHRALSELGREVVERLGGSAEYVCKLTSGYHPKSGVRGSLPKDLWFGVYRRSNHDPFVGHPQLYMIASDRGLEYGYAALTHPSDFSNAEIKEKVRAAAGSIFSMLPEPASEEAFSLGQLLKQSGSWAYRRKERLQPNQTDFPTFEAWLEYLHSMTDFRNAGGNVSRYLVGDEIEKADLAAEVAHMVDVFRPLMEQVRAGLTPPEAGSPSTQAPRVDGSFASILASAVDQFETARQSPFGTVPALWATMDQLIAKLGSMSAMQARPHIFAKWSLGKGVWAKVPWIALMNRNITTSTQNGLYVVFLLAEDHSHLFLTLNQGMTKLVASEGEQRAVEILKQRAEAYRSKVGELAQYGFALSDAIDLRTDNWRAKNYQPSTIAFADLDLSDLPTDQELEAMLEPLLAAYDRLAETEAISPRSSGS